MSATVHVKIMTIPGVSPTQLEAKIDEIFSTSPLPETVEYKVMGATVQNYEPEAEDDEESSGDVSLEMYVNDKAITDHFGEDDAEDEMNEDGYRAVLESALESILNKIDDVEFCIESVD